MQVYLDHEQIEILGEILQSTLHQLRTESSRADSHDFRVKLHERERIVESMIAQIEREKA